jgi:hypothetical protein
MIVVSNKLSVPRTCKPSRQLNWPVIHRACSAVFHPGFRVAATSQRAAQQPHAGDAIERGFC